MLIGPLIELLPANVRLPVPDLTKPVELVKFAAIVPSAPPATSIVGPLSASVPDPPGKMATLPVSNDKLNAVIAVFPRETPYGLVVVTVLEAK